MRHLSLYRAFFFCSGVTPAATYLQMTTSQHILILNYGQLTLAHFSIVTRLSIMSSRYTTTSVPRCMCRGIQIQIQKKKKKDKDQTSLAAHA